MSFGLGTPKTTTTPAFGTTSTPVFQPASTQGFNFSSGDAPKPSFDFAGGAKPFGFNTPAATTAGSSAFNLSATSPPNFSFATPKTTTSSLFGGAPSQPTLSFGAQPQAQQQQAASQQSAPTGFGITSPLQSSSGFSFNQQTSSAPLAFGTSPKPAGLNLSFGSPAQVSNAPATAPSTQTATSGLNFGTSGGGISFGGGGQTTLGFGQPAAPTTGGLKFGQTTAATLTPAVCSAPAPAALPLTKPAPAVSTAASSGFGFMTPSSGFSLVPKTTPAFGVSSVPVTTSAPPTSQPVNTSSPLTSFLNPSSQPKPSEGISFTPPASNVAVSSVPTAVASTPSSIGVSAPSTAGTGFQTGGWSASSGGTSFQSGAQASKPATSLGGFGMNTATTSASTSLPSLGGTGIAGITSLLPSSSTAASSTAQTTTSTTTAATTSMPTSLTTATITTPAQVPQPLVSLNFTQLEENINKWTLDLEEQEKIFINQATQINAWDRLLISNGEKIVELNEAVQSVKGEQESLEHELDFVLAQQKELEELLAPLEKDLANVTIRDPEREHMYQMAENVDTQLKQMSEDLKEIIEHLNESNRNQDSNDPIVQIRRILNAHMSSMQWIDTTTAQISNKLDQLSNMHNTLRCDNQRSFQLAYNNP